MHQTTIRFGADLWGALSRSAEEQGISIAQYVREAAVARMAHEAAVPGTTRPEGELQADTDRRRAARGAHDAARGAEARSASRAQVEGSLAVWAQGRQARARARAIREHSARIRAERPAATDVVLRLRAERLRRAGELHGVIGTASGEDLVVRTPLRAIARRA